MLGVLPRWTHVSTTIPGIVSIDSEGALDSSGSCQYEGSSWNGLNCSRVGRGRIRIYISVALSSPESLEAGSSVLSYDVLKLEIDEIYIHV